MYLQDKNWKRPGLSDRECCEIIEGLGDKQEAGKLCTYVGHCSMSVFTLNIWLKGHKLFSLFRVPRHSRA
jgi:hypothetical protein